MPPRIPKPRRKFTPEELQRLEKYSAIRLPYEQMASLFGISDTWLMHLARKDDAVRLALEQGRAKGSANFRGRLYEKAMTGDVQAMKFWAVTQEGFVPTERIQLTGENGEPIKTMSMTSEQRIEKIRTLVKQLADTEDEL